MRNRRIEVSRELKTATRRAPATTDAEGNVLSWKNESYMPAHVWIVRLADGKEWRFHHDDREKLFQVLSAPNEDSNEGGDSSAVLVKLNNYKLENLRSEKSISAAALRRLLAAIKAGKLVATR